MTLLEVIVIVLASLFVVAIISKSIYNKVSHKPSGECACCRSSMKRTIKNIKKELHKD